LLIRMAEHGLLEQTQCGPLCLRPTKSHHRVLSPCLGWGSRGATSSDMLFWAA
jgi:hypothetical protein